MVGRLTSVNHDVEILEDSKSGRGVFWNPQSSHSRRRAEKGELLIELDPVVNALDNQELGKRCAHCFCTQPAPVADPQDVLNQLTAVLRRGDHFGNSIGGSEIDRPKKKDKETKKNLLRRCGGCKVAHYCGVNCQKADWLYVHEKECRALTAWKQQVAAIKARMLVDESAAYSAPKDAILSEIPDARVRLLARLLWSRKLNEKYLGTVSCRELQSHYQKTCGGKNGSLIDQGQKVTAFTCLGLGVAPPDSEALKELGLSSLEDVFDLVSKAQTNSFGLTSGHLDKIGVSLSPLMAMVNHSCSPNAIVSFPRGPSKPGTKCMKLVAIRELEPGEEIRSSYIDVTAPFETRQRKLKEDYCFQCDCALCAAYRLQAESFRETRAADIKLEIDPRHAGRCTRCRDGTRALPPLGTTGEVNLVCNRCSYREKIDEVGSMLQNIKRIEKDDSIRSLLDVIEVRPHPQWKLFWLKTFRPRVEKLFDILPACAAPLYEMLSSARHFFTLILAQLSKAHLPDYDPATGQNRSQNLTYGLGSSADLFKPRDWWVGFEVCLCLSRLDVLALTGKEYGSIAQHPTPTQAAGIEKKSQLAPLYPEGHPGRTLSLVGFGRWLNYSLNDDTIIEEDIWVTDDDGDEGRLLASKFFPDEFLLVVLAKDVQRRKVDSIARRNRRAARARMAKEVLTEAIRSARIGSGRFKRQVGSPDAFEEEARSQLVLVEQWMRENSVL